MFQGPQVQLGAIAPEIALSVAALVLLLLDSVLGDRRNPWHLAVLTTAGIAVAVFLAVAQWGTTDVQIVGSVVADGFSAFVKVLLGGIGILTVWLSREYLSRQGREDAEYYALVLFALAGMMLMVSAADLIVLFLALETFSICLYVLVGSRRVPAAQEAALKYFLLGAFSSAFFLLGVAFAYGAVGTTSFYGGGPGGDGIVQFLANTPSGGVGFLVVAVGLVVIGLAFKVAAVPFHMWTPDAYQGAPSPVTGFMAAASKVAAFAAILRLLDATFFSLRWDWQPIVIGLAVATMLVGSILAVVQEDLKRLLAYSSIAHAGFILVGVVPATDRGVSGSLFYLTVYALTVVGSFAVLAALAGPGESRTRLADHRGSFFRQPMLTAALSLFLLSLAGVPITSGFVGKLVVFGAAIDAGYSWLVVVGVIASAIAAFFYLRVLVVMYMQESEEAARPASIGPIGRGVIGLTALATLVLGLYWGPLIELAGKATLYFAG